MDTHKAVFSGQPEKGTDQSSHSSSKNPAPDGPTASASSNRQTGDIRKQDLEAGGATSPAPSTVAIPEPFSLHLNHLHLTSRRTQEIVSQVCPGHKEASDTMALAWDLAYQSILHEKQSSKEKNEQPDIGTIASIIQKLMSASSQIKNLELKVRDQERSEEDRQVHKAEILKALNKAKASDSLTGNTLSEIEQLLNLL